MYVIKIQPQNIWHMIAHDGKTGNYTIESEIFLSLRLAEEHYRITPPSQMNKLAF